MTRYVSFCFFNDTATTEIYTLSLHDALPISNPFTKTTVSLPEVYVLFETSTDVPTLSRPFNKVYLVAPLRLLDRKSTRLNSSHANISYAVFCLKKKTTYSLPPSTLFYPVHPF